jgi:hypothetical protein
VLLLLAGPLVACNQGGAERSPADDPEQTVGEVQPRTLAPGHWTVAARAFGRTVLVRLPDRGASGGTQPPRSANLPGTPPPEVFVYAPSEAPRRVEAEVVPLSLPDIPAERARPLAVARIRLDGADVYFGLPTAGPTLLASPTDPEVTVFEEANALWVLAAAGLPRRITAERVGDFAFGELAARQREGEVILYWAAAPVWSPDGRFIAYVTNREAVAAGQTGQAVWLLEVATGTERALLREPGRSYRPVGWLEAELVFIGSQPGVWAIDPATGAQRLLASGVELDIAEDASAVAIAEGVPEATVVRVLSQERSVTVPPPPVDFVYVGQALFSPDGRRLLLEASAQAGRLRRFLVFDRVGGEVREIDLPETLLQGWPAWLDDETLLVNGARADTGEIQASVVPVP